MEAPTGLRQSCHSLSLTAQRRMTCTFLAVCKHELVCTTIPI